MSKRKEDQLRRALQNHFHQMDARILDPRNSECGCMHCSKCEYAVRTRCDDFILGATLQFFIKAYDAKCKSPISFAEYFRYEFLPFMSKMARDEDFVKEQVWMIMTIQIDKWEEYFVHQLGINEDDPKLMRWIHEYLYANCQWIMMNNLDRMKSIASTIPKDEKPVIWKRPMKGASFDGILWPPKSNYTLIPLSHYHERSNHQMPRKKQKGKINRPPARTNGSCGV